VYGKLFESMYDGTLGTKGPWQALVTFQQLIILADSAGLVDMTPETIARRTTIPLEIIKKGIAALEKPDPDSRSPDENGKRIIRLSDHRTWGWEIVNHARYREIRSKEERREYFKHYQRERRAKRKMSTGGQHLSTPVNEVTDAVSSKQYAVSSKQLTTPPPPAHTESLEAGAHRTAYSRIRDFAKNPEAFDAMLGTIAIPLTGGTAFSWLVIGQALVELNSSGGNVSAASIRGFCRRVVKDSEPPAKHTRAGDRISAGREALKEGLRKHGSG
jgi:hypothetical protein